MIPVCSVGVVVASALTLTMAFSVQATSTVDSDKAVANLGPLPVAMDDPPSWGGVTFVAGSNARSAEVADRKSAVSVVTCMQRLENPHWSKPGKTILFKVRVTCTGNLPTIRVRVRTFLARVPASGGILVAGSLEDRTIAVTGSPSQPFYTPKKGAKRVRKDGRYRGQATLEIIQAGGVKSSPVSKQTPLVSVNGH